MEEKKIYVTYLSHWDDEFDRFTTIEQVAADTGLESESGGTAAGGMQDSDWYVTEAEKTVQLDGFQSKGLLDKVTVGEPE